MAQFTTYTLTVTESDANVIGRRRGDTGLPNRRHGRRPDVRLGDDLSAALCTRSGGQRTLPVTQEGEAALTYAVSLASPSRSSFDRATLPTSIDMPAGEIAHIETPAPYTLNGIKGMGEGGNRAAGRDCQRVVALRRARQRTTAHPGARSGADRLRARSGRGSRGISRQPTRSSVLSQRYDGCGPESS